MNMVEDGPTGGEKSWSLTEWIAGCIGLILTLGLLGLVGWQAVKGSRGAVPHVQVRVTGITRAAPGYVVAIQAENSTGQTAGGVQVEGRLTRADGPTETSNTSFDYIPGHSVVKGGLFFTSDPRKGELQVRPLGYRVP